MEKIRVLHLINTLNLGGAESNLLNIVEAINKKDFDVYVGYSFGGDFEKVLEDLHIKLFKFSTKICKVRSFDTLMIILRLSKYILKYKINIVHTHTYSTHVWGSLAAKLTGVKVFEHVHDPRYEPPEYFNSRGLPITNQFRQSRYFAKLSDKIVVLTRNNLKYLLFNKIADESRIKIILNGIKLDIEHICDRNALCKRLEIDPDKKIIFSAMRLSQEKHPEFILEIVENLEKSKLENLIFIIAGDGPERISLENEVSKKSMQTKIRFIGFYSNVRELLSIADMFILPTLRELHSITMIEAMSLKVPVLVSQGAGCNDYFIKHGENGFVLNPFDARIWATTIEKLLCDSELIKKVGNAGRELVERECDIRKTVKDLESIYRNLAVN